MNAKEDAEEEGPTGTELHADWLANQDREELLAGMSGEEQAAYWLRVRIEKEEAQPRTYYEELLAGMSHEERAAYWRQKLSETDEAQGLTYYPDFAALLAAYVAGADLPPLEQPSVRFCPGKYGREDIFELVQRHPSPRVTGRVGGLSGETTLAALRALDELVKADAETSCCHLGDCAYRMDIYKGASWFRIGNKTENLEDCLADARTAWFYERRMREQELIAAGKLKRGHVAFGYYPLDGGA